MNNFTKAFGDLDSLFIGFDKVAERAAEITNKAATLATKYPPYNLKKVDENRYTIEIAVAGFAKQDIDIEIQDDKLIIKGNVKSGEESTADGYFPTFLYQGLAMRPFTRVFTIADNVEIRGASMLNGILKIALEAIIPESKKTKVEIKDEDETSAPSTAEYLAERKDK